MTAIDPLDHLRHRFPGSIGKIVPYDRIVAAHLTALAADPELALLELATSEDWYLAGIETLGGMLQTAAVVATLHPAIRGGPPGPP